MDKTPRGTKMACVCYMLLGASRDSLLRGPNHEDLCDVGSFQVPLCESMVNCFAEAQNLQELGRSFRFRGPLGFWVHGDVGFRVHGAEHVSRMADLDCSVKIRKSLIRFRA